MTNLHPIGLSAALPAIERDLAERRAAASAASAGTAAALRTLAATQRAARTGATATLLRIAPRLAGAA